jgi:purine-binding chemotaxis protein CheW
MNQTPDRHQYATFVVGGHFLGVRVLEVQEVLRDQRITPVPLAPDVVAGLINLRGQIVPELDLRKILGLRPRNADAVSFSVVVRTGQGAVSLRVDDIDDVLDLDASSLVPPPVKVDAAVRTLLSGVHKLKDRLLLVLKIAETVDLRGPYRNSERNLDANTD